MDSRGRIVIPKEYRMDEKEYRVVRFEGSIRLILVPKDPVEDIWERKRYFREVDKRIEEIKEEAIKDLVDRKGELLSTLILILFWQFSKKMTG